MAESSFVLPPCARRSAHVSYFFNVIDGEFLVDEEGTDCLNMRAVRDQAITTAGAILREKGGRYPVGEEWQMYVTDEGKKTVLKLRFSVDEPA